MSQACTDCGAAVAEDQRYCVTCGAALRPRANPAVAEVEPDAPEAPAPVSPPPLVLTLRVRGRTGIVRLPSGRLSTVLAAGMLAAGLLIGIAVGPVALGNSAAAAAGQIITLIGGPPTSPQAASTASSSTTSSDSAGAAGSLLSGPGASPATPTPAPAPASAAPAGTPPAAAATPSTSTSTTSTSTALAKLNAAGTVIANDFASQSFDVVDAKHKLLEVHPAALGAALPAVGSRVKFAGSVLANGTTSASRTVTVKGTRPATVIADGVVSFVNTASARYVLSAPGVSLPIDTAPSGLTNGLLPPATTPAPPAVTLTPAPPATPASPTAPALPSVGQRLEVTISLPPAGTTGTAASGLREVSRVSQGQASGPLDLAGLITSFDKTKEIATISADGPGVGIDTIPLSVPPSMSLKKLSLPATVVAHATLAAGIYTLTGLARDDSPTAAADRTKFLGDWGTKARSSRVRKRSRSPRARARARGNGA